MGFTYKCQVKSPIDLTMFRITHVKLWVARVIVKRQHSPTDVSSPPPVDNPQGELISPHGADVIAPTGQKIARTLVERRNERTTSYETATADGNGPDNTP